ncbi:MAG: cytochrome P450 [Actinomycetes bacterium]
MAEASVAAPDSGAASGEDFIPYDPIEQFQDAAGDVRDPYPDLAESRRTHPVYLVDWYEAMGLPADAEVPDGPPMYTVFSHQYVHQVLSDNETFSSSGYAEIMGQLMGHTILEMDAPEHPRHRALVAKAFRTRMLERWSDALLKSTVDELIDQVRPDGKADLVRALTFPFPVRVIARILGLPEGDWAKFQRWSIELISVGVNWDRAFSASSALKEYFTGIVAQKREEPGDDLISQLVCAEVDGHVLTDEEIFAFLRLLLPAGAETTYRSSGNLLYGLLTHPDQLDAVRNDRSLIPQAIEEGLRWEPPLLFIMRTCKQDTKLGDVEVPAGSNIGVAIGAANRDPDRYPDPDTFNIFRDPRQHIAFGAGPHICLGQHLARLETRIALESVFDKLPNLRLDPDAMASDDPHIHGMTFRSPTSLPVLFDPS